MKTQYIMLAGVTFTAGFITGSLCSGLREKERVVTHTKVEVRHDTIAVVAPEPALRRALGSVRVTAPRDTARCFGADSASLTCDSVSVVLPITQNYYRSDGYEAWVSGFAPRLDSLKVINTTVTRLPPSRQRHWGISAGAGLTVSSKGLAPGVFVGVSYTFVTF